MQRINSRLSVRLAISHIALALGAILLASLLSNLSLRSRFDQYVASSIDQRIKQLAASVLAAQYQNGNWNMALLEQLGITALEDGFLVTVVNADGYAVWDARTHNAGLCSAMISSMAERMSGFGGDGRGNYQERRIELIENAVGLQDSLMTGHGMEPGAGQTVSLSPASNQASLLVGYWGPVYYRDADLDYLKALNRSMILAGALALALAAAAGLFTARRLAEPLLQATKAASRIANGDYDGSLTPSSITELSNLGAALSSMVASLQKQETLRKQLSIDASHELRTPLAALRSRLEGIKDGILPPSADNLDGCLAQVERLTALSRSLEHLAAADALGFKLHPVSVRLDELIRRAIRNVDSQAQLAQVCIETVALPEISIQADEGLILQAIENLLDNAIRYGKTVLTAGSAEGAQLHEGASGADVLIELRDDGDQAVLKISDRGIGIAADQLELIFERFYRIDRSRNRASGGFGVGLAIVREAIRHHGGTVQAISAGPGRGSCFETHLPKRQTAAAVSG